MALPDYPNNPTVGQTITLPSGIIMECTEAGTHPTWEAYDPRLEAEVVKQASSVSELREKTGSFNGQTVQLVSYYAGANKGGGVLVWNSTSTAADDGGVTFAVTGVATGRWIRSLDGYVTPEMFGARVDNASDDFTQLKSWMQFVLSSGVSGAAESNGTALVSDSIIVDLNNSATFELPSGFVIKAAAGFPAKKLMLINTGSGSNHVFRWKGGQLNGENIPLSDSGQANDMFYYAASNSARCDVYFDKTYSGQDWLNTGSDSHVFIAGSSNIKVEIGEAVGAFDAAVYISGDFDGVIGDSCEIYGNYSKCNVAAIVKRQFKSVNIDITTTDCLNGAGSGGADISGFASAPGGDGLKVKVNALRTERPCFLQATQGGILEILSRQVGVSIAGYTSTASFAALISGASAIAGFVVADGVNPACTVNSNFVAVRCEQRVFATGTYNPSDNNIMVIARNIGRAINEDAIGLRNIFTVSTSGNSSASSVLGANSTLITNGATDYIVDSAFVRLSNGLRVQRAANAVNNIRIDGGLAGAASGCIFASEGADASVPITINPKGTGAIFIGGSAGTETVRVGKGGVNALEIPASAASNPVILRARGADAAVDLQLEPKGTGKIRALGVSDFADDAAAATGGVPINGLYRTGSILKIRVS